MKKKPLIFTIITILFLIEPLIKIIYFKIITQFDFTLIISNLFARNSFRDIFDFWLVYPIAGILLVKPRKWSYLGFMSILAYMIYSILNYEKYTWPYYSDSPFMFHYVVVTMSIFLFIFFLFPSVREPFFDRRVRWWEVNTRYPVAIACVLKTSVENLRGEIINISSSGAFLSESSCLKIGDKLILEFSFFENDFSFPVTVINKHAVQGRNGYGVRFSLMSFKQILALRRLIEIIKRKKV